MPLGRPSDVREVAAVIAFLAEGSFYATGAGASCVKDRGMLRMGAQAGSDLPDEAWRVSEHVQEALSDQGHHHGDQPDRYQCHHHHDQDECHRSPCLALLGWLRIRDAIDAPSAGGVSPGDTPRPGSISGVRVGSGSGVVMTHAPLRAQLFVGWSRRWV